MSAVSWAVRAALVASTGVAVLPPELETSTSPPARHTTTDELPLAREGRAGLGAVLSLRAPGPRMLLVPASTFVMGSTSEDLVSALVDCQHEPRGHQCEATLFADETPQRRVSLSPYWLDRTEVTVADYARCVAAHRCRALPFAAGGERFDRPSYPASLVTYEDAKEYCAFRGARLPTEAEFERAARGPAGRKYPWGNLYNSHAANHGALGAEMTDASDGFAELAPVGSFPEGRTPEGFLDLAGNVAEWMLDRYAAQYVETDTRDPQGPSPPVGLAVRVVRGGSYASAAPWLRGAARAAAEPTSRRPTIGFRCAKDARRSPPAAP